MGPPVKVIVVGSAAINCQQFLKHLMLDPLKTDSAPVAVAPVKVAFLPFKANKTLLATDKLLVTYNTPMTRVFA